MTEPGQQPERETVLVYAPSYPDDTGFTAKGARSADPLREVVLDDEELRKLKSQVDRIATVLKTDDAQTGFKVDSITVHVGISAKGKFFFVAEAGAEASVDVTWKRPSS